MKLGDIVPDFSFETNIRKVNSLHNYIGEK